MSPTKATDEDRRVTIVRQECANATLNTANLFAVCGAGSVGDPFRIVHEVQLMHLSNPANETAAWLATACNGGQCNFKLVDNLNMSGVTLNGPIGTGAANQFHSNFDGNGKTISNLTINSPADDDIGLFGDIGTGAEINNVSLINVNINGNERVGGLVGTNDGSITNSSVAGVVTADGSVGGLAGENGGDITNSYATGAVEGAADGVGGLVGDNDGDITNSYATGEVTGLVGEDTGGLVGENSGIANIVKSYSTGMVDGNDNVGGLVGYNDGTIEDSYATGVVTGLLVGEDTGGLVGENGGGANIIKSYATGMVDGNDSVGGLVGYNDRGTIEDSYSTGVVIGNDDVGGLIGETNSTNINMSMVTNSYSTGTVDGNDNVGGLVGNNDPGTIEDSYATGEVTGNNSVGGLVGSNAGNPVVRSVVTNSYSTGAVIGNDSIGGLVGWLDEGDIINSYATGAVDGGIAGVQVGGLVGFIFTDGIIENSYATGTVDGGTDVGGLIGDSNGTINGVNYFMDADSVNGIGGGVTMCTPAVCIMRTIADLRDALDEMMDLPWISPPWGALGGYLAVFLVCSICRLVRGLVPRPFAYIS